MSIEAKNRIVGSTIYSPMFYFLNVTCKTWIFIDNRYLIIISTTSYDYHTFMEYTFKWFYVLNIKAFFLHDKLDCIRVKVFIDLMILTLIMSKNAFQFLVYIFIICNFKYFQTRFISSFKWFVKMNNHDACPIGSCADDYHLACLRF